MQEFRDHKEEAYAAGKALQAAINGYPEHLETPLIHGGEISFPLAESEIGRTVNDEGQRQILRGVIEAGSESFGVIEVTEDRQSRGYVVSRLNPAEGERATLVGILNENETLLLGRNSEKGYDDSVSREHCELIIRDGNLVVTDLDSTNGTRAVAQKPGGYARKMIKDSDPLRDVYIWAPPTAEALTMLDAEGPKAARASKPAGEAAVKGAMNPEAKRSGDEVEAGNAERSLHGEDKMLFRPDLGLFGVFDGAGGERGGAQASVLAMTATEQYVDWALDERAVHDRTRAEEVLKAALKDADEQIDADPNSGITTGVLALAYLDNHRQRLLSWASVGDSRIYIYNRNQGTLTQLSEDEGHGHIITNALGADAKVEQAGTYRMQPGDEVMMCTDGVTGDYEHNILREEEIIEAMQRASMPRDAAANLVTKAKKEDDRSAIVFREKP